MAPTADQHPNVKATDGPLGILIPGMGAVATTFFAGCHAVRKGLAQPIGSLSQLQTIRLGARSEGRSPLIRDFVPLADIEDLRFGGWDIHGENSLETAQRSEVLEPAMLDRLSEELTSLKAMDAVFSPDYVKKLTGKSVKKLSGKRAEADALRDDIRRFREENGCQRVVVLWAGSTEIHRTRQPVHESIEAFEQGLDRNDPEISPSMLYAYAAIKEGCPYANGAPNLTCDTPALTQLAEQEGIPIAGKDFKTGQTLVKTTLAPMIKARMLGLDGWFSTNLLGNRDGEVLEDPGSFKTKEETKLDVLDTILQPEMYPELYGKIDHMVRINYYPPRGDAKEGWDNIDIFGWLGYKCQLKVNFLARDSILAAPLVLDLVLFLDLAHRAGLAGVQDWLSFYFKAPQPLQAGVPAENDIFIQHRALKNMLRWIGGEKPVTHVEFAD